MQMDKCASKKLHLGAPLLDTYDDYALFSGILSDQEDAMLWFYNHFINISYDQTHSAHYFSNGHTASKLCPWIIYDSFCDETFSNLSDKTICEMIIDCINRDFYLIMYLDIFYLKDIDYHLNHKICIYGYDQNNDTFYIADNTFGQGKFTESTCSFQDLEKAYHAAYATNKLPQVKIELLRLFKYSKYESNKDGFDAGELKPYQIVCQLENYIYSRFDWDYIHHNPSIYGMKSVEYFIDNLNDESDSRIDMRAMHLFYERKKLMVLRLNYINEVFENSIPRSIIETTVSLEQNALKLRNMALKYNLLPNKAILEKIRQGLTKDLDIEKELSLQIIERLNHLIASF